jgi:hypothetical protein
LPVDPIHPQENSTDDNRKRHDHEPGIDIEQGWNRQFAVVAELEKIVLNERIRFRVEAGANQNTENTAKQSI